MNWDKNEIKINDSVIKSPEFIGIVMIKYKLKATLESTQPSNMQQSTCVHMNIYISEHSKMFYSDVKNVSVTNVMMTSCRCCVCMFVLFTQFSGIG